MGGESESAESSNHIVRPAFRQLRGNLPTIDGSANVGFSRLGPSRLLAGMAPATAPIVQPTVTKLLGVSEFAR